MPKGRRLRAKQKKGTQKSAPARAPKPQLAPYIVRDLTAAARKGRIVPGRRVEARVARVLELLESGRSPLLLGASGVGKTTLAESVACALATGRGRYRRVVEISLRGVCQRSKTQMGFADEFARLTDALVARPRTLPYIRDLHVAYELDLEHYVDALFVRIDRPLIAEGEAGAVETMLEDLPGMESYVSLVRLEEPSVQAARALAVEWASECAGARPDWTAVVEPEALDGALEIARRFEVRDRLPRTLLQPLAELGARAGSRPVTLDDVVTRATEASGLPRALVDPRVSIDLDDLERRVAASVVGQGDALRALIDAIGLFKAGLADPRRPLGAFLFTGPTGVGKTEAVRALAREMLGDERHLLRVNMADHQSPEDAGVLFGRPWAMSAAARRGTLTRLFAGRGFGVVLLDEFEKAAPEIHDHFMQLLDEGQFVNGAGETIACRSFLLVATSNAGARAWKRRDIGFAAERASGTVLAEVQRALAARFRVELLNRFDRIVAFAPLSREDVREIARRELARLERRPGCARRGVSVEVDPSVVEWVAEVGYDVERGARPLRRVVERRVAPVLARTLLANPERRALRLYVEEDVVRVE